MPAAHLYLHLLGLFRLLQGDQPVAGFDQARLQHLLAYLVLHRAAPILRQQLAFLFWPDSMDQQALKNLRTLPTRLRQALPDADHFIAVTARTIQWRPDAPLTRAIPYTQRLLQHDPLHEPAYRRLMRLHLALGGRTDALRIYHACDTMLQREFGMGPTRATKALRTIWFGLANGRQSSDACTVAGPPDYQCC